MNPSRICLDSSAAAPLAKTGGLADVTAGLTRYLDSAGHDVRLFLPLYRRIREESKVELTPSAETRNFSTGMIALRPDRDGQIVGYDGLEHIKRHFAPHILDLHIPPPGSRTQGVEGGYMANAWIRMRHADYDQLRSMLDKVGETVRVRAQ